MLAQEPEDAIFTGDLVFDEFGTLSLVTSNALFDASSSGPTPDYALRATFAGSGFVTLPGITSDALLTDVPTLTDHDPTIAYRVGARITGVGLVGSDLRAIGVAPDGMNLANSWFGLDSASLGEVSPAALAIPSFSVAWDAASVVLPTSTGGGGTGGGGTDGGSGGGGTSGGGTDGGGSTPDPGTATPNSPLERTGGQDSAPVAIGGAAALLALGAGALIWAARRRAQRHD